MLCYPNKRACQRDTAEGSCISSERERERAARTKADREFLFFLLPSSSSLRLLASQARGLAPSEPARALRLLARHASRPPRGWKSIRSALRGAREPRAEADRGACRGWAQRREFHPSRRRARERARAEKRSMELLSCSRSLSLTPRAAASRLLAPSLPSDSVHSVATD